jgi:hypothetical protein
MQLTSATLKVALMACALDAVAASSVHAAEADSTDANFQHPTDARRRTLSNSAAFR